MRIPSAIITIEVEGLRLTLRTAVVAGLQMMVESNQMSQPRVPGFVHASVRMLQILEVRLGAVNGTLSTVEHPWRLQMLRVLRS